MPSLKAYILDRFAKTNRIYKSWLDRCPAPIEIVDSFCADWTVPDDAGIIITHLHYRWEEIHALRKIVQQNTTPVLILSDGILEFRNTWQNPTISDGSIFQPLIGHKLACIGRGQARVVESWGNVGKCEVVGLPRLDEATAAEVLPIRTAGPFRLLVATANTPAFDDQQRAEVVSSLRDLKHHLESNPSVAGRPIEVRWRLTDGLDVESGLPSANPTTPEPSNSTDTANRHGTLAAAIEAADAVITTPSTLYFESVLQGRPTAILDYSNSPSYVPAAWSITAARHIDPILAGLANPPASKLLFQKTTLHDQLECATPGTPRLFELIQGMIELGATARHQATPLKLPSRMLADPQLGFPLVESDFGPAMLYPNNAAFQQNDVEMLQAELSQAIARLAQMPFELDRKNADLIRKDKHIDDLKTYLDAAQQRIDVSREKNEEYQARLEDAWQRITDYREKESKQLSIQTENHTLLHKKIEHIRAMEQLLNSTWTRALELRAEFNSQPDQRDNAQSDGVS